MAETWGAPPGAGNCILRPEVLWISMHLSVQPGAEGLLL